MHYTKSWKNEVNPEYVKALFDPDAALEYGKQHGFTKFLINVITTSPKASYNFALLLNKPFPEGEPAIATSGEYSFLYALNVLKKPFKKGELAIAESPYTSLHYAKLVLEGSFPEAEHVISKYPDTSYIYAKEVLKAPFLKGEPAIATDPEFSYSYAEEVLHGPFLLGEKTILQNEYFLYFYCRFLKSIRKIEEFYQRHPKAKNIISHI